MDEEIQELVLSLYDDGLLEPPPAANAKKPKRLWKCIGTAALFSLAIFSLFFVFDLPRHHVEKAPEITPPTTYERSFWSVNDLSPEEPVTEEIISHLEILQNEETRREAFKTIQTEMSTLLESPYPIERTRLQPLVERIYRIDLAYTDSLPKDNLPFLALVERREHYDKIVEKQKSFEATFTKVQEASTLFELNEIVCNATALLEKWQSSFDVKEYRQKLHDLSLETVDKIAAAYSYTTDENAQKEREALWSLQALLPRNLSILDPLLSSHSEHLFMEVSPLPQNEDPLAFATQRQIEMELLPRSCETEYTVAD